MKKFILSVVYVCLMVHVNSTWALPNPLEDGTCINEGTCVDAIWDEQLGAFYDCKQGNGLDESGNQYQCSCTTDDLKTASFDCMCTSDYDCSRGTQEGYCDAGKCRSCVSDGSDCTGSVTTAIDDCNYKVDTLSWSCSGGCSSSTTYGCYTGGTDGPGTYTCR